MVPCRQTESDNGDVVPPANVFATNADGTLTVIHQDGPDVYHVAGSVPTPTGSRNMGLDPTTHRIFVAAATFEPQLLRRRRAAVAVPMWSPTRSKSWSSNARTAVSPVNAVRR